MTKTSSRRTVLGVLGFAPALPIAVADFAIDPSIPNDERGMPRFGVNNTKKIAAALRAMADEVESGGIFAQKCSVHSSVSLEDFVVHNLSIEFVMREKT